MNPEPNPVTLSPQRHATLVGLSVVGFLALVGAGIFLAVYAGRFVPSAVSNIAAAAVTLSSAFTPARTPGLLVVPGASTTANFSASETGENVAGPSVLKANAPATPSPGTETKNAFPIGGASPTGLSGLPDLSVTITAVGYLTTNSTDSFVAGTTTPAGNRPAVKFTVKNVGTNFASSWRFSAAIPTQNTYVYQSLPQQSLNPGDSIDYTLGFDQPRAGLQTITITANFDNAVAESDKDNDTASASVTILGS